MKPSSQDIFTDSQGRPRRLRGVAIASGSTRLAEMAVRIGFETAWIEMEHGPVDFSQVESLCVAIEAGGGIPTVRVPDSQRHHVLRALEVGASIVVVPMVNGAAEACQIVDYGKFPPLGSRGFNLRSRGLGYGLDGREASFAAANTGTHLFAQIETRKAVDNVREICGVEGLSGIFIGPGDLSSSMGRPGDFANPEMIKLVVDTVRLARSAGKHAGIFVGPGPMLDAAVEAGCDLLFLSSDATGLANVWTELLGASPG